MPPVSRNHHQQFSSADTAAQPTAPDAPPSYTSIMVGVPAGNRPALPEGRRNPLIAANPLVNDPDALVVKFQTIVRDKREIIVGRLKVQTGLASPNEHAFILRRYDTQAISVSTMFKAAFPTATAEEEEREMKWIKSSFDMSGMNGSRSCDAVKLAGTWVPPSTAAHLAVHYRLGPWVDAMVNAQPESGVAYRKSQRSQAAASDAAATTPATTQRPVAARGTRRSTTPASQAGTTAASSSHPEQPAPKRTRATSTEAAPAIQEEIQEGPVVDVTLTSTSEIRSPAGVAIDAEAQIAENRAMVLRMKEEALARARAGESAEDMGLVEPGSTSSTSAARGKKRTAAVSEQESATSGIVGGVAKKPAASALKDSEATRQLKANKRVVTPQAAVRRQAIWGGVFLAIGAGAAYIAGNML